MGLSIKYVIGWTQAESGYTSLMCIPDGRVVRLSEKLVSAYCAHYTRCGRAIVKRTLASSL